MSADNGIYILKTLDGYRVVHAQAIDNLYWWDVWTCCSNPVPVSVDGQEQCYHCGDYLPKHERRDQLNPQVVAEYFGHCELVAKTEYEAWEQAKAIYDAIMDDDYCPIVEYGVQFIKGMENENFPIHLVPEEEIDNE